MELVFLGDLPIEYYYQERDEEMKNKVITLLKLLFILLLKLFVLLLKLLVNCFLKLLAHRPKLTLLVLLIGLFCTFINSETAVERQGLLRSDYYQAKSRPSADANPREIEEVSADLVEIPETDSSPPASSSSTPPSTSPASSTSPSSTTTSSSSETPDLNDYAGYLENLMNNYLSEYQVTVYNKNRGGLHIVFPQDIKYESSAHLQAFADAMLDVHRSAFYNWLEEKNLSAPTGGTKIPALYMDAEDGTRIAEYSVLSDKMKVKIKN